LVLQLWRGALAAAVQLAPLAAGHLQEGRKQGWEDELKGKRVSKGSRKG
jgi:hypothetical protein